MINALPFPSKPDKLIENRRIYGGKDVEFSIYDTFQTCQLVELTANNPLYCGMITGRKVIHMDERTVFEFVPDESLVVPSGKTIHIDFPDAEMNKPTQCVTIEIDRDKVQEIVGRLNEQYPRMQDSGEWEFSDRHYAHFSNTNRLNQNLDHIIHCFTDEQPYRDVLIDLNTSRLIIHMLQSEARRILLDSSLKSSASNGLQAVIQFIRANLHTRIAIEQLEKIACCSRASLYRYFQQEMGCSPVEFITRERMNKAAIQLRKGDSVTQTCYEFGYQSVTHFSQTFKKTFGVTPGQYRISFRS
ncbi:MAG: AraC family transcriptional regulator N-terminal domain-containing protein [Bacteroidetes bacterium]|nr:AraC family transcriptional regulator N-terminal domain-containing protein [Bacteroidota bacterium]MCH8524558.1 AraC family transcriptional regulator [Balneolales bacterium]